MVAAAGGGAKRFVQTSEICLFVKREEEKRRIFEGEKGKNVFISPENRTDGQKQSRQQMLWNRKARIISFPGGRKGIIIF